jgi:hypothetical protein
MKYIVKAKRTQVIEYRLTVDAPYASWDTPEQEQAGDSAECVANKTNLNDWKTNSKVVEDDFEIYDIVSAEPAKYD